MIREDLYIAVATVLAFVFNIDRAMADGITQPEWLAQFYGRRHGNKFDDIQIISGSTLSSSQLAAGVKRIMSTLALVLDPPPG